MAAQKIVINIPESLKGVSSDVWEELEGYIFNGFLHSHSNILKQNFVFKTLNQNEVRMIEFMRPSKKAPIEEKTQFKACFIAYSTFMVNGKNVLVERNNIDKLVKTISKIPAQIQDKIIENLAFLNAKANRLYPLTEVYVGENRSRFKWFQIRNSQINSVVSTGIPGTDQLGLNHAQSTWVALNAIEDRKEEHEKDWNNAKFIGSCFAGKSVKEIDNRDKAKREREQIERNDHKLEVLKAYLNRSAPNEVEEKTISLPDGRQAVVESRKQYETVEELAEQLASALNNEQDAHDRAVEAHFKKMTERNKEIDKNVLNLNTALPEFTGGDIGPMSMRTLTPEGVKEYMERAARLRQLQLVDLQKPPDSK